MCIGRAGQKLSSRRRELVNRVWPGAQPQRLPRPMTRVGVPCWEMLQLHLTERGPRRAEAGKVATRAVKLSPPVLRDSLGCALLRTSGA